MSNGTALSEFKASNQQFPVRFEKIWLLLLHQKRTFPLHVILLECLREFKHISPVLTLIQETFELKLKELCRDDPSTKESYVFNVDFSPYFDKEKSTPPTEVVFSPLQAIFHLETLLTKCISKTVPLEPHVEKLKTIMKYITTLQNVIENAKLLYCEEDEMFCIKAFPLMLRIAVLLHPLGEVNGDQFIRDFLHWIYDIFLSSTAPDIVRKKFRKRIGLKICKNTLSIFSHAKIFNILMSPATDYTEFLETLIKSKFGPQVLAFCPVVLSCLFVRCQVPTGGAHFREENYWLAMHTSFYIIKTLANGDITKKMSLEDVDSVIATFPLIFESNARVKINGKNIFLNKCLMRYVATILLSEIIMMVPEILQGNTISLPLGSQLLVLAATESIPLSQIFLGAMHSHIKKAASQGHLTTVCAATFIIQEVFKENTDHLLAELIRIEELLHSILTHFSDTSDVTTEES